jgi:Fe-S-cluster-containing hydrogenase component 2
MEKEKKITIDIEKCDGCRSCELACSFYIHKSFDPARSHIKVYRNDANGTIEIVFHPSCDGCKKEPMPYCIRYCSSDCLDVSV